MVRTLYKASAPGSVMLMGEHAVLHHQHALVAALDKRIHVTLIPRTDEKIFIYSNLGQYETTVSDLRCKEENDRVEKSFQFVIGTLQYYQEKLNHGFELKVESEFSEKMGFGSSAAVVVATLRTLTRCFAPPSPASGRGENDALFQDAKAIIQKVQGMGSGADVSASIYGGILLYKPAAGNDLSSINSSSDPKESFLGGSSDPKESFLPKSRCLSAKREFSDCRQKSFPRVTEVLQTDADQSIYKLNILPPLVACYSGYKKPTAEVVQKVEANRRLQPILYKQLYELINTCVLAGYEALEAQDWQAFGMQMNVHHGLQSALGVSDKILDTLVHDLRINPGIYGAKISGAGLGDCVIGLGSIDSDSFDTSFKHQVIPLQVSATGIQDE